MKVVCFSTYLTSTVFPWRPQDHDAHKFIDAIKDRDINGYAYVPVRGIRNRFDNVNRQQVVCWFATMVADYLKDEGLARPYVFVPVPGSKVDVNFAEKPRTTHIAACIAKSVANGCVVQDVLRWRTAMPSANAEGGTRDPHILRANLQLTGNVHALRVILIDDVLTSGGHLQACAAKLWSGGAEILLGVCCGRSDQQQPERAFATRSEDLADIA